MGTLRRLSAYAGLWTLVGLLGLALVFVAAAAGPVQRDSEDRALRATLDQAPMRARDILVREPVDGAGAASSAAGIRDTVQGMLPDQLARVVEAAWGAQWTDTEQPGGPSPGLSVSLTGAGGTEPTGLMPLVTIYHQTDLAGEVTLVEGTTPDTGSGREAAEIEVMVAARVAEALGLRAGQVYHLLPGVAAEPPQPLGQVTGPVVAVRVSGVFRPRDPAAPAWQLDQRLLRVVPRYWPHAGATVPLQQGTLVTDQAGIDALLDRGLNELLQIVNVGRVRLDTRPLDATWTGPAREATRAVQASPDRRPDLVIETGLVGLIDEFERQAAAARAMTAVVVAGVVGTGVGLLLLAARVAVDRRRGELALLRARGGSRTTLVGWLLREAALVVLPAAVAGWLLHRLLPGRPDPGVVFGVGAVPLAVAAAALLAVPAAALLALRRAGRRHGAGRPELTRQRPGPVRLTAELAVLLLAGLGVLLLHQRGLTGAFGTGSAPDPYLSAVPVLIGVAAGLLALRLYPWPLRVLGALTARRRGVVGFLGLARAGRVAPATALPVLVLVLAVAVGGFAGAVSGSVAVARDTATVREVGADLRVAADGMSDATVAEVRAVPGVTAVAAVSRTGFVRVDGSPLQNLPVLLVDTPAYQQVLAAIGTPARLPEPVVAAGAGGSGPVPVVGPPPGPERELTVTVAGVERPVTVVGGVAELPALAGREFLLVPRQAVGPALPAPPPVDELLVAGPGADPLLVRAAVAGATGGDPEAVTVTSLTGARAELENAGFNRILSLAFAVGTAGAAAGGLLAVGLAVAVQAAARGRALSLLRTMGLSARQARGLLLVELVPLAALAVAVGAASGTAMPVLLAPALGLTEFTGGAPLPVALDPTTVVLLVGLLAGFVVAGALVEAALNRRLGLGQVLRVDTSLPH